MQIMEILGDKASEAYRFLAEKGHRSNMLQLKRAKSRKEVINKLKRALEKIE